MHSYMGYDQEDFQDMNQVTRRGSNWRNLQINGQARSIEFTDGSHQLRRRSKPRTGFGSAATPT